MAELEIPKEDVEGLALLRDMPEDSLNAFIADIEGEPSQSNIPGLSPEDADHAKETLSTMYTIRAVADVNTEAFINDICDALYESDDLKTAQEKQFKERLERLLEIERLKVAAKAATLRSEHERFLCSARVLTDARPVYSRSASDAPAALIITHELKLTYHEGPRGTLQEIYVSLGGSEMAELQEQLQRAQEKEQSLRQALRPSQIRIIDQKTKR